MTKLTFHGAARTVTGSKYLLEAGGARVLIDCGLFQGLKELRERNWAPTPFDPATLDAVVLTHAHLDHVGFLPRIVREGFGKPVYCTPATRELAEIILLDSAKLQEDDAAYANRKGFSKHHPALPLYETRDVQRTMELFADGPRNTWFCPAEPIWMRYHDAGHLLGSALVEVEIRDRQQPLRILFSGDVGRYDGPLYHDPTPPPACDYLVCESTYGNRDHPDEDLLEGLAGAVERAVRRGGVMLMAAFAVGRAQQLIYLLQLLKSANRIPDLPVFLDSPMACNATDVYRRYAAECDLSEAELNASQRAIQGREVILARTQNQSKAINQTRGPAIIIASSGMMTGGRIVHHLQQRLPDARNTIILGGYQAVGTRGRLIEEGAPAVRMHGQDVPVRAAVEKIPGLSGHADRTELLRWLDHLPQPPRRTFLTHGEPEAADALAEHLRIARGWTVDVPALGAAVELAHA